MLYYTWLYYNWLIIDRSILVIDLQYISLQSITEFVISQMEFWNYSRNGIMGLEDKGILKIPQGWRDDSELRVLAVLGED